MPNYELTPIETNSTILGGRTTLRPLKYDWAFEFYEKQQQAHWLPADIPMHGDIEDWHHATRLLVHEKFLITQILRFFTQGDLDVASGYVHRYLPALAGHPEIRMMLLSFAAMEAVHVNAYELLLSSLGFPDSEHNIFMEYEEMRAKHEYVFRDEFDPSKYEKGSVEYVRTLAKSIAVFSAFTEGLQLFGSFVMLLNFTRFGLMRDMGQIVAYSIRDESMHVDGMIRVFREMIEDYPWVWTDEFKKELYNVCRTMVELEIKFIQLAYSKGAPRDLPMEDLIEYIHYLADRRLVQLGLKPNYGVERNPLPWVDHIVSGVEHANYFETESTEYAKGSLVHDWDNVWGQPALV